MNPSNEFSLRFRLIAATLSAITVIWIAVAISAWSEAASEADHLFDQHLSQFGKMMAGLVSDSSAEEEIAEHLESPGFIPQTTTQVWSKDGELLFRTADAPPQRLSEVKEGFSNSLTGNEQWRVYSISDVKHRYLVQVAESATTRAGVKHEVAAHLLMPIVVALPLLAGALIWLIGASLGSLTRLAASIAQRTPERLDPIPLVGVPKELQPILEQLNRLFIRVGQSMEQERRFTADAAHELRTPLAAMRANAQVARSTHDDGERDRSLDRVIEASDRTTRLVAQMLTLARVDAAEVGDKFVSVNIREIAAEAIGLEVPLAFAKSIELGLEDGPDGKVRGNQVLLAVLVRNLIDNAVRYSPAGSAVTVVSRFEEGKAILEVIDSGPGIPADERVRVLERFARVEGHQETGSGLGLSISARIAELHKARLELADGPAGKGLCVRIVFPHACSKIEEETERP